MRFVATVFFSLRLVFLLAAVDGRAQDVSPSEYQLKAAFLFNFAKFIEWPTEAFSETSTPFVIGILGDDPFGQDLQQTIHGKTINNRLLVARELHSPAEATNCQIVF